MASTPTGSVRVRVDGNGLPVEVHIVDDELRFGGRALAVTILALCRDRCSHSAPAPWTQRA